MKKIPFIWYFLGKHLRPIPALRYCHFSKSTTFRTLKVTSAKSIYYLNHLPSMRHRLSFLSTISFLVQPVYLTLAIVKHPHSTRFDTLNLEIWTTRISTSNYYYYQSMSHLCYYSMNKTLVLTFSHCNSIAFVIQ